MVQAEMLAIADVDSMPDGDWIAYDPLTREEVARFTGEDAEDQAVAWVLSRSSSSLGG